MRFGFLVGFQPAEFHFGRGGGGKAPPEARVLAEVFADLRALLSQLAQEEGDIGISAGEVLVQIDGFERAAQIAE